MAKKNLVKPEQGRQLSMFDEPAFQDVPAPELIARGGNGWTAFPLQSKDDHGVQKWAVQDWIAGITHSKQPRRVWSEEKARHPELYAKVEQLPYTAKNGRSYPMDYADDVTLYEIVGYLNIDTILRTTIINLMAQAMHLADELRRDPAKQAELKRQQDVTVYQLRGKPEQWAQSRVASKKAQAALNQALFLTHEQHTPDYSKVAATQNQELFDMTKREIVTYLGLLPKDEPKYRDMLGQFALQAIDLMDTASKRQMMQLGRDLTTAEQIVIVREKAQQAARIMKEASEMAGIDFISGAQLDRNGKPLISRNVRLLGGDQ